MTSLPPPSSTFQLREELAWPALSHGTVITAQSSSETVALMSGNEKKVALWLGAVTLSALAVDGDKGQGRWPAVR